MDFYLISSRSREAAFEVAKEMKLKQNQWTHIPLADRRKNALLGRRVADEKYLIGSFSDEEKAYLIRPRLGDFDVNPVDRIIIARNYYKASGALMEIGAMENIPEDLKELVIKASLATSKIIDYVNLKREDQNEQGDIT